MHRRLHIASKILTVLLLVAPALLFGQTFVNVKSYGAVGDSLTDDTQAILNAVASTGDTVYFPAGKYRFTGTMQLNQNQTLLGSGRDSSIMYFTFGSQTGSDVIVNLKSGDVLDGLTFYHTGGGYLFFATEARPLNVYRCNFVRPVPNYGCLFYTEGYCNTSIYNSTFTMGDELLPLTNACVGLNWQDTMKVFNSTVNAAGYAFTVLGNNRTYLEIRGSTLSQSSNKHGDIFNVYKGTVVCDSSSLESQRFTAATNPSAGFVSSVSISNSNIHVRDGLVYQNESAESQIASLAFNNCTIVQDSTHNEFFAAVSVYNTNLTMQNVSYRILKDNNDYSGYVAPSLSNFLWTFGNSVTLLRNVHIYNASMHLSSSSGYFSGDSVYLENEGYPATAFNSFLLEVRSCAPGSFFRNSTFSDSNVVTTGTGNFVWIDSTADSTLSFQHCIFSTTRQWGQSIELGQSARFDTCFINGQSINIGPSQKGPTVFNGGKTTSSAPYLFTGSGSVKLRNSAFNPLSWVPAVSVDYNDRPPNIVTTPSTFAIEDSLYRYHAVAADPDTALFSEVVHYRLLKPQWLSIDSTTGIVSGTPTISNLSDTVVVLQAYDLADSVVQQQYYLHIEHVNHPPSIVSIPVLHAAEDTLYSYRAQGSDADTLVGDFLVYSLTQRPAWMNINSSTGLLSGIPRGVNVGDSLVTVKAVDTRGVSTTQSYMLNVVHTNHAPTFVTLADTLATEDSVYSHTARATDVDSALFGDVVHYALTLKPTWLTIDSVSGKVTGVASGLNARDTTATVVAFDNKGGVASQRYSLHVKHVNHPPAVLSTAVTQAREDSAYVYAVKALDPDSLFGDVLRYSLTVKPTWLTIDSVAGKVGGMPRAKDVGDTVVTVAVNDGKGGAVSQNYALHITHTNHSPVFASSADTTATEDTLYTYRARATDVDSAIFGDIVHYAMTVRPSWLRIDSTTGVVQGTSSGLNARDTSVTVAAYDNKGGFASQQYNLHVRHVNHPPVIVSVAVTQAQEDSVYWYTVKATDPDSMFGDVLSYSLALKPTWLTIDSATGNVSGTPRAKNVGDTLVTVAVKDGKGGTVSQNYAVHITHTNHAPAFVSVADTLASEDSVYSYTARATDADSTLFGDVIRYRLVTAPGWLAVDSVSGVLHGFVTGLSSLIVSVDIRAYDGKGGSADQIFTIRVSHTNHAPFVLSTPVGIAYVDSVYKYAAVVLDPDSLLHDTTTFSKIVGPTWLNVSSKDGIVSGIPRKANMGDTTVSIRGTDQYGLSTNQTWALKVVRLNHAPLFASLPDTIAVEDSVYRYRVYATDPDSAVFGDYVRYRLVNGPLWLQIDSVTGVATGTPRIVNLPDTMVTVEAYDNLGGTTPQTYKLHIRHVNHVPTIESIAVFHAAEDTLYRYQVVAVDPDTLIGDVLSYTLTRMPSWLNVNASTGLVSGIPRGANVGDSVVTVQVSDGKGGIASESYTLSAKHTNHPPAFVSIADTTASEDSLYTYRAHAIDTDSTLFGDVVHYALPVKPVWLTIDSATGVIRGTALGKNARDTVLTIRASDQKGGLTIQQFTLRVRHVNHPPVISSGAISQAREDSMYVYRVQASDQDTIFGDVLRYTLEGKPFWLAVDSVEGIVRGVPYANQVGDTAVRVTVSDGKGGIASQSFALHVSHTNHTPVFVSTPDTLASEDTVYVYPVRATDRDSLLFGDRVSISLFVGPHWLHMDSAGSQLTGRPTASDVGDTVVTLTASDGKGGAIDQTFRMHVRHINHPPRFTSIPAVYTKRDSLYWYRVTEYDPDRGFGDTVTCRIVTGPGWLLFDPKRNVLLGVPRIDDVGDTVTVLQADDGKGGIGRQAFTIHVAEAAPDVAAPNYVIPVPSFDIPFTMPMRPFVFLWPRAVVAAGAAVEEWSIQVSGRGVDTVVRGIRDTSVSVNLKNTIRPSSQYTWYLRARIDGRDTTVGGPYAFVTSSASRLVVISSLIPEKYLLYQNYPNPFNGGTVIRFALPVQSEVSLKLYNILGQEVKNLLQDNLVAGYQELYWEPVSMATGTYFIVMRAKGLENDQKEFCAVKKLLYLK